MSHIVWRCKFALSIWDSFLEMFGVNVISYNDCHLMMEVVVLHPLFRDKGCMLCFLFFCFFLINFYGAFGQREMKELLEGLRGQG